jgi:KUP system potassium uptake protein
LSSTGPRIFRFGRRPISVGWLFLVFPAAALSYFGQGALILSERANLSAPFFLLTPGWGRIPMVLLATAATVIASRSVISGAFSVAAQAAQLGYLPRLRVVHTSWSTYGQIYVPWVNWLLRSPCSSWCSRSAARRRSRSHSGRP